MQRLDAIVVSYGGAGTTELLEFLAQGLRVNHRNSLRDGIKHINSPEHPVLEHIAVGKAIYLYDDPVRALVSVFRRNLQDTHGPKLTSPGHRDGEQYREYVARHATPMTLDDYLGRNADLFGFESHFHNWTRGDNRFPVLLVRFDVLYESAARVLEFLGLPAAVAQHFPKRRPRGSSPDLLTAAQRQMAEALYAPLRQAIAALPPISERPTRAS